jgi:hypothetical protein
MINRNGVHLEAFSNEIGRQTPEGYTSKDIYPILISPNRQKRIFPITFWRRIFWGYNILILNVLLGA